MEKLALILVFVIALSGCQAPQYSTNYFLENSSGELLFIETEAVDADSRVLTFSVKANASVNLANEYYGLPGQEKIQKPPSSEFSNIVVRKGSETGEIVYMGIVDDDWERRTSADTNNESWTLVITNTD